METCEKKEIAISPSVSNLPLGDVPRAKYPLVVLLYNPEALNYRAAMTTELAHQIVSTVKLITDAEVWDFFCRSFYEVLFHAGKTPFNKMMLGEWIVSTKNNTNHLYEIT